MWNLNVSDVLFSFCVSNVLFFLKPQIAEGATHPEGEENPAVGGSSRVYIYFETTAVAVGQWWLYNFRWGKRNPPLCNFFSILSQFFFVICMFRLQIHTTRLFLLRLTHPTSGIEPGGRIEVCDHRMSFVSATLNTLPSW